MERERVVCRIAGPHCVDASLPASNSAELTMQSSIFVRPNLKGFILGGVIVVVFHSVLQQIDGLTIDAIRPRVPAQVNHWTEQHYHMVLDHVAQHPTSESYLRLGAYQELRRDHKKALMFMKRAELLATVEAEEE